MGTQYGCVLFVLSAVCSLVCSQVDPCILNRLDVLSCQPHSSSSLPEQNEYAIYRTTIDTNPLGCRYRNPNGNPNNEIISAISTLGTDELRLIHSPGFVRETSYRNRLVVVYNISCGPGRLAFYNVTSLDLDPQVCDERCVDYVEVDRGEFGVTESSACTGMTNNQLQIERSDFTVRFRSSDRRRNRRGFQVYVVCYDPMEANAENCTEVGSDRKRRSVSWEEMAYQQGAQTAAASHHQRYNRDIHMSDEIVIQFGEEVTYRRQVIQIRTNERKQKRIFNVTELNVLEGSGEMKVFFNSAFSHTLCERILKFSGPARLFVAAERAWLELFAFNPVGVRPIPEEAEIVTRLTEGFFTQLDPEDDVIFDTAGSGSGSGSGPGSGAPPTNSTGNDRRKRGTVDNMISDDAILDAFENENACNAVLRTSARATLVVACCQDPDRVYQLSGNQTVCDTFPSP